jgi:hypothetical protein
MAVMRTLPLWLISTLLAGQPALADTPPETSAAHGAAVNAQVLGTAESALDYCGTKDPAVAERLRLLIKGLVQGVSEEQLAKVRQSDEYRAGYDSVVQSTSKIEPANAKKFCASAGAEVK